MIQQILVLVVQMNMKKNNNQEIERIICPVCKETSEIIRVSSITVDDVPMILHKDVGEIYQCMNPACLEYLVKVHGKYEPISRIEILKRQKEITDLLEAEAGISRARLFPREAEIAMRAERGRALSPLLYHYTSETPHYRAYSVDELLEACDALGFNPSDVGNRQIGFILTWLREHKD